MTEDMFDVLVAGGGPGGSSVATMLRKRGRTVLLVEKERHPRFHIGESLLPHSMELLRTLGVMPAIEAAGFVPKWGAGFQLGDGTLANTFYFRDGMVPGAPGAYQVLRSTFDHLLLDHSRASGADVREGHALKDVSIEGGRVTATIADETGRPHTARARFFADATGQHAFLANKLRMKAMNPALQKIALYGHLTGVRRDTGIDAGNTISIAIRGGWIWFIPLADDITSIGVVVEASAFKSSGLGAEDYYERVIRQVPAVASRIQDAARVSPVRTTSDYSYAAERLYGDRYLIVGDAGFFLDPIFSSGVHLAIRSGMKAALAIDDYLSHGVRPWRHPLKRYQRIVREGQRPYFKFCHGWYTPGFLELFLRPTTRFQMVPAIVSVLAGSAHISWRVTLRIQVFLFLVWLNRRFELEPPIDRAGLPPHFSEAAS
jgi:flavin-dependent dehydrogenase